MKLNESEKERIRKLHKAFSVIKEQEEVDVDITPVGVTKDSTIQGGEGPQPKMGGASSGVHVFTNCATGSQPIVPTAMGLASNASPADVSNASMSFYSMVGSPSPGTIVFVTAFGGAAGGPFCLKYMGLKPELGTMLHAPLDLNGGTVQFQLTFSDCATCESQKWDYNCESDGPVQFCNNVQWGTGQFSGPTGAQDCQACIANPACQCGGQQGTEYCVDCDNSVMTTVPAGQGCPQGFVSLGANPNPPQGGPCIECLNGNCQPGSNNGWNGNFNSMSDCQNQCQQTNYMCDANGQCQPDPNGPFPTLAACQQNCGTEHCMCCDGSNAVSMATPVPIGTCGTANFGPQFTNCVPASGPMPICTPSAGSYNCVDWTSPSGCQPAQGQGGQFPTLDDCLISPCQCDSIILAWPFYQNNPNNPQGNWSGAPNHDGPSNPNALATQLTNVQNSNAYNSTNVVQNQKAKCREAAILHWQSYNPGTMFCCADPGFAVGAANSDPLGCVTTGWINTMTNFMNNHANWPGQGCNWLNNALANVTAQQANFQPGSAGWCKTQGKINFINNFKATGNSAYLPGQAAFALPCI